MRSRIGTLALARGIVLLCIGNALALCACSKSPEPAPAPVPTPVDPAHPPPEDFSVFDDPSMPKVVPQELPNLSFVEVSSGLPDTGTWRGYPLLADFSGHGQRDLVVSNREEDGFSAWTLQGTQGEGTKDWQLRNEGLPRGMSYGPCAALDLDGDGALDLIANDHQQALRLFQNVEHMKEWKELPPPPGEKRLAISLATGDLDGNGRDDLAGIGHFRGGITVYLNQGPGRLEPFAGAEPLLGSKGFGRDIHLEDVDHDGIPDIVCAADKGARVFLTKRGQELGFEDASRGLPETKAAGNSIFAVAVGRFVQDSPRAQVVVALIPDPRQELAERSSLALYAWDEETKAWARTGHGLVATESYSDVHPADFDGDGKLDLVAVSFQSGIVVYRGDGAGNFTPAGRLPCRNSGRLAVGDIDGDGAPDVVLACPSPRAQLEPGGIRVFLNRRAAW